MIKIIKPGVRYAGSLLNVNESISLPESMESSLVLSGKAVYLGDFGWPVNELGEIVVNNSHGSGNVSKYVPGAAVPFDYVSRRPAFVSPKEIYPSVSLVKPHGSFETSAGTLGYTLNTTILCPVPFFAVRLRMYNANASATVGVLAAVAASANMTGGVQAPTGTPVNITVGGSTSITKPAAISGGSGNDAVFSEVVTDWAYVTSVDRNDGGKGYLLMVREYQPSAGNTEASRSTGLGNTIADVNAYGCAALAHNGDRVTSWGSWVTAVQQVGSAFGVELLTASGVVNVSAFGDSTVVGQGGTRNNAGGIVLSAVDRINNLIPVGYWNYGEGGSQTSTYYTLFKNVAASDLAPTVAVYCPFSPNDTDKYTRAGTDRQIATMLAFINDCRKYNITPVLLTPCPENGRSAADEAFRREVVVASKSIAAALNIAVIDRDAIYTDYTNAAGGFKTGTNSDTKHPCPAGYALESPLWVAALANYR